MAKQKGLVVYFRSQEAKELQREGSYSIWIRYQEDGRTLEMAQRLEPSDVEGYQWVRWDKRPASVTAVGVRKEASDPRLANGNERMYLLESDEQSIFSIAPDGLVHGKPASWEAREVTIHYRSGGKLYLHYCTNMKPWTILPGEAFGEGDAEGFLKISIPLQTDEWIAGAAMTDGQGWWDNNGGRDYSFFPGQYCVEPGIAVRTGEPEKKKTTRKRTKVAVGVE